ncbi:hypothetical protein TGAM01_v210888 [Trichoderma gamsii]|uniref:Pfs domain-containing protein n=1 Tax=Trichoderma gamsii TaxID=398673 RepID=A0A2P4Z7J0_9HYPO|nr:hypothetical protein TGAM01_v210888 [Trichoderma gamsii]PON20246.1 hypothetical protein TGAM01_v210888 [Trichoderma gamsii]
MAEDKIHLYSASSYCISVSRCSVRHRVLSLWTKYQLIPWVSYPQHYTIAWIAPLEIEAIAATHMLDNKHHGRFSLQRGDDYVFVPGDICGHNVIIATLPAGQEYGIGSAAALASQVKKFFPNLWFGLLVGIAAGLPTLHGPSPRDIRLGDVLVALPPDSDGTGLIAYDLGRETTERFQLLRRGYAMPRTEAIVMSAIGTIKRDAPNDLALFLPYYNKMKDQEHANGTFNDPGQDADRYYETDQTGAIKLAERECRKIRSGHEFGMGQLVLG